MPEGSLAATAFEKTHYQDAYAIDIPEGCDVDVDELIRVMAKSSPRWAEQLMWLRNRLVSVVGLRTSMGASPESITKFEPGDSAGIFRVYARSDTEILLGGDDKHLDFRASMLLKRDATRTSAVLSTVVHFNNPFGRAYFLVVQPFHGLIVASLLNNMRRRLIASRSRTSTTIWT